MATPSVTGTPQAFAFTASGTAVTYTGGGSTGAGVYDVLCVNSDNTVVTPSGWALYPSRVLNQGSYIFVKAENGVTTATIDLGGGVSTNTDVVWIRIKDSAGLDTGSYAAAGVDANVGSSATVTSNVLGDSASLAIAFAALHGFNSGLTPVGGAWSSGYGEQATTSSTSGAQGSRTFSSVATKVPAGTAAESPTFTWTNTTSQRYMLFVSFLPSAGGTGSATPNGISVPVTVGTPTGQLSLTGRPNGLAVPIALGVPRAGDLIGTIPATYVNAIGAMKEWINSRTVSLVGPGKPLQFGAHLKHMEGAASACYALLEEQPAYRSLDSAESPDMMAVLSAQVYGGTREAVTIAAVALAEEIAANLNGIPVPVTGALILVADDIQGPSWAPDGPDDASVPRLILQFTVRMRPA